MDMYQKRKIRAEKKNNDSQKSFSKVSISWYPGHMAKTKKQITEDMKLIDIVVEILDARIPLSSQNPEVDILTKGKKRIEILNKSDLADNIENNKWLQYFRKKGIEAVITDSNSGKGMNDVIKTIEKVFSEDKEIHSNKGRVGRAIRVLVIGIPNVGKSSFINRLSKRTSAKVGNKPGVTRQKQWIKINENIQLLDTPGILWPKLDENTVALNLAYTGTIKDTIIDSTELVYYFINDMIKMGYLNRIIERYKLDSDEVENILNDETYMENERIMNLIDKIALKRGAILSGGRIDYEKISNIILNEYRDGKLGNITLETPSEL